MDKIIRGCAIAKFCGAIKRAYPYSIPGKLSALLGRKFKDSATLRLFVAFFSAAPKTVYSKLYALLLGVNNALARIGNVLRQVAEGSVIMRVARRISSSESVSHSVALNAVKRLGLRGILLMVFALYLPADVFIRNVLGIDFLSSVWDEGFMLVCVMYIFFRLCTAEKAIKPRVTPIDAPLIFFMSASLLVLAVVSPKLGVAIGGYRAVCQFMLWFFVLTRLIESDSDLRVLYFTICAMATVVALHGIYQYITNAPMPEQWVAKAEAGVRTRVYSITGSPNVMGALMVMTAPMLAACAYYAKKLWVKCAMWGCTGIICLATLFTFSRGAWFGLTVAVFVFALLVDRKLLLFGAIGIGAIIISVPEISNRIAFLFTSDFAAANATGGRGERWQIGLSLWRQNKIFGFGLGRYGGAIAMQNQEIDSLVYYYMDNYYLKTLTEMGLVGLVSYVWLLLKNLLWSCRSIFRTRKDRMSYLSSGIVSGGIGVLSHSFFENIFEVPYMNAYFWGLAAAVMFIGFIRRRSHKKRAE